MFFFLAPGNGPVTSNTIFGFRTDILLQLLNIKARRLYPDIANISDAVPVLLQHLYKTMGDNDLSVTMRIVIIGRCLNCSTNNKILIQLCFLFIVQFYQELLFIQQTEMATPSHGSYLTPAGQIMPPYSGRGRPPLNPQHSVVVNISNIQTGFVLQLNSFFCVCVPEYTTTAYDTASSSSSSRAAKTTTTNNNIVSSYRD